MKKIFSYTILLMIINILFICNIKADYAATALNPNGATCEYRSPSTGYCFYKDSNLNSSNPMGYLDTGDEVTVITSKPKIASPNENKCPGSYVYVSQYVERYHKTYYGYYCDTYLSTGALTDELKNEFRNAGFPESYWEKLAILKQAHPNWSFKAINTNLNFNDAVTNQTYGSKSLLRRSMSNNLAYLSTNTNSFDYYKDYYKAYDDISGSDPWYLANYDAIAYYVDPRNFLNDMYIFQFETLSYDSSISDDNIKISINSIFGDDYLNKYTNNFLEAGKISGVNPIYLATLSKEEVGNGTAPGTAINGKYNGMYNFYNIGANSGNNPVYNGLNYASNTDSETLRPWNTEYKAIVGGAKWIYNNYVSFGQDTSYFKKYNVVYNYLKSIGRTPIYNNYAHQYMQNIQAPSSEAFRTYKSYFSNNMLGLSYTFFIPVYNDMPEVTKLPTKSGWPNNYLSSLTINDRKVESFDGGVENYNYNLDIGSSSIKLEATSVSNSAKIEGLGTFNITGDTTKTIKVIAENGDVKNYNINIKFNGIKLEKATDVSTTLNNASIKNNQNYITGINIDTDISVIKNQIINSNNEAIVTLKNNSGNEKNNGVVATGDVISISVGNDNRNLKVVIYGDANGDGKNNNIDYIRMKKYLMNEIKLDDAYREAIDITKDGNINNIDFIRMKKYLLGDNSIIVQ